MNIDGQAYRSIWPNADGRTVDIIDQTRLPHEFLIRNLSSLDAAAEAIFAMRVRGAPLIGATAAYGVALALDESPDEDQLQHALSRLFATRPTAVNLRWALQCMEDEIAPVPPSDRAEAAFALAARICPQALPGLNGRGRRCPFWPKLTWQNSPNLKLQNHFRRPACCFSFTMLSNEPGDLTQRM